MLAELPDLRWLRAVRESFEGMHSKKIFRVEQVRESDPAQPVLNEAAGPEFGWLICGKCAGGALTKGRSAGPISSFPPSPRCPSAHESGRPPRARGEASPAREIAHELPGLPAWTASAHEAKARGLLTAASRGPTARRVAPGSRGAGRRRGIWRTRRSAAPQWGQATGAATGSTTSSRSRSPSVASSSTHRSGGNRWRPRALRALSSVPARHPLARMPKWRMRCIPSGRTWRRKRRMKLVGADSHGCRSAASSAPPASASGAGRRRSRH